MTDLTWQVLPHYKPVITEPATRPDGSMINYENDFTQLFLAPHTGFFFCFIAMNDDSSAHYNFS